MSLIEILITLCLIGILSSFILPNYENNLLRTHRTAAEISLEKLAAALEEYALTNNTYENATLENLNITAPKNYALEIVDTSKSTYSLKAIPINSQEKDTECATLTFNSKGEKGITGSGSSLECWS